MRYRMYKLPGLLLALFFLAISLGCGSEDLLDEPENMYTASISIIDNGTPKLTIDTFENDDCNNDGAATTDDIEPFTDVFVQLSLAVDSSVNGLHLVDYDIQYVPLLTPLAGGGSIMPITLEDITAHGATTFSVPSGGSGSDTFTFMLIQTKVQYDNWRIGQVGLQNARYLFRFTCFFEDDFGVERTFSFDRTVLLGPYDNC